MKTLLRATLIVALFVSGAFPYAAVSAGASPITQTPVQTTTSASSAPDKPESSILWKTAKIIGVGIACLVATLLVIFCFLIACGALIMANPRT